MAQKKVNNAHSKSTFRLSTTILKADTYPSQERCKNAQMSSLISSTLWQRLRVLGKASLRARNCCSALIRAIFTCKVIWTLRVGTQLMWTLKYQSSTAGVAITTARVSHQPISIQLSMPKLSSFGPIVSDWTCLTSRVSLQWLKNLIFSTCRYRRSLRLSGTVSTLLSWSERIICWWLSMASLNRRKLSSKSCQDKRTVGCLQGSGTLECRLSSSWMIWSRFLSGKYTIHSCYWVMLVAFLGCCMLWEPHLWVCLITQTRRISWCKVFTKARRGARLMVARLMSLILTSKLH